MAPKETLPILQDIDELKVRVIFGDHKWERAVTPNAHFCFALITLSYFEKNT